MLHILFTLMTFSLFFSLFSESDTMHKFLENTSIYNNGYFQGMYALCQHTISLTHFTSFFFSLQMKCQIITFINSHKITYIPIILLTV